MIVKKGGFKIYLKCLGAIYKEGNASETFVRPHWYTQWAAG